jgi:hypothetical protein
LAARLDEGFRRGTQQHEQADLFGAEPVPNPERRRERTQQDIALAQAREPDVTERFSRVPRRAWDANDGQARRFLLEQYHGRCQMCSDGFLKQDGTPYFEGLYLVSHTLGAWLDRPGNMLCLCATCCAKMQFGTVEADGDDVLDQLKAIRLRKEGGDRHPRVHLRVCGSPLTLSFTERHILDLQEMLKASEGAVRSQEDGI